MKIILEIAPRTLCWESLFLQSLPVPTGLAGRVCQGHKVPDCSLPGLLLKVMFSVSNLVSWCSTSSGAESRLLYGHGSELLRYCNQLCAPHLSSASYVATERLGRGGKNDTNQQEAHATFCAVNKEALPLLPRRLASSSVHEGAMAGIVRCKPAKAPGPSQSLTPADTYLECLEPRGVLVALVIREHLFHRNGQVYQGHLETQHFPLCLSGLWDPGIRACQLALEWYNPSVTLMAENDINGQPEFGPISTKSQCFDPGSVLRWVKSLNGFSFHRTWAPKEWKTVHGWKSYLIKLNRWQRSCLCKLKNHGILPDFN